MKSRFRYKTYFKFTGLGKTAISFCIALFISSITSGANLLFFLSTTLITLFIYSFLSGYYLLKNIEIRISAPLKAIKNKPCIFNFKIKNNSFFYCYNLKISFDPPLEMLCLSIDHINPHDKFELNPAHVLSSRGYYKNFILYLQTSYPFHFLILKRKILHPANFIIYPAISTVKLNISEKKMTGNISVQELSSANRKGHGGFFYGIRDYIAGEPLRWIHWPKTAQTGNIMVKEYESFISVSLSILILENRKNVWGLKKELFEKCIDHLAGFVKILTDNKLPVSLITTSGEKVLFREGMDHVHNFSIIMDFLTVVSLKESEEGNITDLINNTPFTEVCFCFFPENNQFIEQDYPPIIKSKSTYLIPVSENKINILEYPDLNKSGEVF